MLWFIVERLDEVFMPDPEKDDRKRWFRRLCLIAVIAVVGVAILG